MRKIKVMNLGFRSESGRVREKNILINARKEKPSRNYRTRETKQRWMNTYYRREFCFAF